MGIRYIVALSIAVGHLVGLFFALYLDELRIHYILLYHNIVDLTDLSIELRSPKGAFTWFYTILLFMVIGIILQKFFFKTNEPSLIKTISESLKTFIKNKSCDQ